MVSVSLTSEMAALAGRTATVAKPETAPPGRNVLEDDHLFALMIGEGLGAPLPAMFFVARYLGVRRSRS